MLKLYGGDRSRASIVKWYLEEIGVPYEFVRLDMKAEEHRQPAFLAINPVGKVPAIALDDFTLWESGAILLYLADKYGAPMTLEHRATLAQWVMFANATLGPGIFVEAYRDREMPRLLGMLNTYLLGDRPEVPESQRFFLVNDEFSVADVAVGSLLAYMPLMLKIGFEDYGAIATYLHTLAARPAFQASIPMPKPPA